MRIANNLAKYAFSCSITPLCKRLSVDAVRLSAQNRPLSYRFYNNFLIGVNYMTIVLRYSKCYLCKLPLFKPIIRQFYGIHNIDNHICKVNNMLLMELPRQLSMLKSLGKAFQYPQKNLHSAIGLSLREESLSSSQVKFLTSIEAVTFGFELHNSVGGSFTPNPLVRIGLTLLRKVIKDKYLVLAGDYMHIRGSVLASQTGCLELPKMLAEIEVSLCKQVHLRDQLKNKIIKHGYQSVDIKQIFEISKLRSALTVCSLKGISILQKEHLSDEIFQWIGLLILYRREMEEFMFNFPSLFNRFVDIKTGNGIYCQEYTLTQYLFFQSTQKTGLRLDLAYLNTVQLLSNQITILENNLNKYFGQNKYDAFMKRISYILMMYS